MMCEAVKLLDDNWILNPNQQPGSECECCFCPQFAHNWWSVRLEICRIEDRNYLRLPTADFERMSPPDASVHSSHCRATWWSAVLCGGGQLESARRVTQCAGSVRACAARGSEARGEEHCASCQLMRSGVMPPASVKESEMWQNHYEWELLIVTPKTGKKWRFVQCNVVNIYRILVSWKKGFWPSFRLGNFSRNMRTLEDSLSIY